MIWAIYNISKSVILEGNSIEILKIFIEKCLLLFVPA